MKITRTSTNDFRIHDNIQSLRNIKFDVQILFLEVFKRRLTDQLWGHFYENGPYGCATAISVSKGSSLVGFVGLLPQKLISTSGKEFDYFLQTGLMIKSNYRDLHLFTMLMHRVHSIVDDKKQFVMAFPNKTAILPFRRILNWRQLYQFHIRQYHKTGRQDQTYQAPLGKPPQT